MTVSYSAPPSQGARIADLILNQPELRDQWLKELVKVTSRITSVRHQLKEELIRIDTPGNWDHITN